MTPCAHGRTAERCGACEEEAWAGACAGSIAVAGTHFYIESCENEFGEEYLRFRIYPRDEATARRVFASALAAAKETP